jgi:FkbM family methyltransferase
MSFHSIAARIGRFYPFASGAGSFANLKVFRLLDPAEGEDGVVEVTGGRALVPPGDHVGRAMRFVGDLDPKVSWVVDRAVQPGDVALDIGANLGLVSLRMSAQVGPQGIVHAFEPQPRLQRYLRQTLEMNDPCNIKLHPIALGTETATLEMAVPGHNAGAATLNQAQEKSQRPGVEMIAVQVRALSDYAEEIGLTRVDFIKIDVEGFEANVIRGGIDLLRAARPRVIILEENNPDPQTGLSPALESLLALDYDLFSLPKRLLSVRLYPLAARQAAHDYVAVSRSAPEATRRALGI